MERLAVQVRPMTNRVWITVVHGQKQHQPPALVLPSKVFGITFFLSLRPAGAPCWGEAARNTNQLGRRAPKTRHNKQASKTGLNPNWPEGASLEQNVAIPFSFGARKETATKSEKLKDQQESCWSSAATNSKWSKRQFFQRDEELREIVARGTNTLGEVVQENNRLGDLHDRKHRVSEAFAFVSSLIPPAFQELSNVAGLTDKVVSPPLLLQFGSRVFLLFSCSSWPQTHP